MHVPALAGWLALSIAAGSALFIIGRWFGRREEARRNEEKSKADEAVFYYRGLNFLLSDEPDKAIEEFIKVVRINSETVEIYLSLGNLFRARGEVGRAIRIHQNIIARPTLPPEVRVAALYGLGEDYRQGGFVDRAVDSFQQVLRVDPYHHKALIGLQSLYENEGRWRLAMDNLQRLERVSRNPDPRREANLLLKIGQEVANAANTGNGQEGDGTEYYHQAIKIFPGCVEAYRLLGESYLAQGNIKAAIKSFTEARKHRPSHFYFLVDPLQRAFKLLGDSEGLDACMVDACKSPSASARLLVRWSRLLEEKGREEEAKSLLWDGLGRHTGHAELALHLINLLARQKHWEEAVQAAQLCLGYLVARQSNFQCVQCGFKSLDIYWKCPQCHHWDTMEPL